MPTHNWHTCSHSLRARALVRFLTCARACRIAGCARVGCVRAYFAVCSHSAQYMRCTRKAVCCTLAKYKGTTMGLRARTHALCATFPYKCACTALSTRQTNTPGLHFTVHAQRADSPIPAAKPTTWAWLESVQEHAQGVRAHSMRARNTNKLSLP